MKQKKREISLFSLYDFAGIARHLENMARQGWQLENISGIFWHYRRVEPSEARYAVVFFQKASDLDAAPSQEQQDFWEMCRLTGWELTASRGVTQIFRNPDPNATPIETDPVVQVDNIHASMKKTLVIPNLIVAVCALLQVILQFSRTDNLRSFLTSSFALANILIWGTLGIHCGWETVRYLRWHRKAEVAACEEGILPASGSQQWRQTALLVICAVYILILLFSVLGRGRSLSIFALLYGIVYATLMTGSIRGSQWLMKKKGVSPTTNRVLSCVIGVAVGCVLLFGLAKLVLNDRVNLQMRGHASAETISYTSTDGSRTCTYDFYRDDLPLTVEALLGTEPDPEYSRRLEVSGTPLLTEYSITQRIPYYGDTDKPDLTCTVWEVGFDCLYAPVKESFFKELQQENKRSFPLVSGEWSPVDAAPWGALDAYQYYLDGEPYSTWLLCYEKRFVEIQFDGWNGTAPTATQMALVGETLGCAPMN